MSARRGAAVRGVDGAAPRVERLDNPWRSRDEAGARRGQGRDTAEWVSFGISLLVVAALLAAITSSHFSGDDGPASPEVRPHLDRAYRVGDVYFVPVEIANRGARTAEDVKVRVSLRFPDGRRVDAPELSAQFLAGRATQEGVVGFSEDPAAGRITVEAISFSNP